VFSVTLNAAGIVQEKACVENCAFSSSVPPSNFLGSGISCARSYRTLRDDSFLSRGAFPGTSCQATIGLSLRDSMCYYQPKGVVAMDL
jgi:hypothetical protein